MAPVADRWSRKKRELYRRACQVGAGVIGLLFYLVILKGFGVI